MLTIEAVFELAKKYSLEFTAHYDQSRSKDLTPPKPSSLTVGFQGECAEAWKTLMTNLTEVPVRLSGTRHVTGSGATDGRLYPSYRALLDEVNQTRAEINLERVFS